jgi:hypothetical protein
MSGIIIINRAKKLVTLATDPDFYTGLPARWKTVIDDIEAKPEGQRTQDDCVMLTSALNVAVHC